MRKTNFDQSSTGLNLELTCFYDTCIAQMDFQDNIVLLEEKFRGTNTYLYVGWLSMKASDFERTYKLPEPKQLFKDYFRYTQECDISVASLSQIKEVLGYLKHYDNTLLREAHSEGLLEAIKCDMRWNDPVHEFLEEYYEPEFFELTTSGYSQGDYAKVIIPKEVLIDFGHTDPTQEIADSFQETINHLFWDAPLYCHLDINDEVEFYFTDYMEDIYSYDKGQMLDIAAEHLLPKWPEDAREIIRSFLEDNLPEYPDYI